MQLSSFFCPHANQQVVCCGQCARDKASAVETWLQARDWIHTFTGREFYPLQGAGEIVVEDIAHALANQCRYSGHCERFYSVAEHSVRLAMVTYRRAHDLQTTRAALLHDASEAYLHDLPRPLKRRPEFAFYREAEDRLQRRILREFGLPEELPVSVHALDKEFLGTEARSLFTLKRSLERLDKWQDLAPVIEGHTSIGWAPWYAEERFLHEFSRLWPDVRFEWPAPPKHGYAQRSG